MTPSRENIEEWFAQFNAEMFDGALPVVPIKLSKARTFLGKLQYKYVRGLFGRVLGYSDFVIRISLYYDLSETEFQDTLIHEMVHLHILTNRIKDTSTHGKVFRSMMKDINSRFGRHITISYRNAKALKPAGIAK